VGEREGVGKGGKMTQTLYAHMNKIKNFFKKPPFSAKEKKRNKRNNNNNNKLCLWKFIQFILWSHWKFTLSYLRKPQIHI
jgi:hypothetical protein